ncbi:MAG TPA: ribosome silencing factor [Clostridia bacterium]|nr:ribosome silencing factor [Clostridia bacterium]
MQDTRDILKLVAETLQEKKGSDIMILEVKDLTLITDYFVIATGNSRIQVQALARHVEEKLEEQGIRPFRVEGLQEAQWVLMDYGTVVVHIFLPEQRQYYNLERLWGDARVITDLIDPV